MIGPRRVTPVCSQCKLPLPNTRLVIEGVWWCGDCVYLAEHPHTKLVERPRVRRKSGREQLRLNEVPAGSTFDPARGEIPY